MHALRLSLVVAHASAWSFWGQPAFWRQAALDAVSPVLAALLGGLAVTLICYRVQARHAEQVRREERERAEHKQEEELLRSDLRQEEDRLRAERERRNQLSLDIMRIAFGFYTRLIEPTRVEAYEGEDQVDLGDLPKRYEEFRITARVLEEQLRVYFPDGEARWLWHGVVDMLSVRYYRLVHRGPRLDDMIETHSKHPTDGKIPQSIRPLFLGPDDFAWADRQSFHNKIMKRYEVLLTKLINLVVHDDMNWHGDPVVLEPGRGSRLRASRSLGDVGSRSTGIDLFASRIQVRLLPGRQRGRPFYAPGLRIPHARKR